MKIWKNTATLDGLIDDLEHTDSKADAEVALLGSKPINLEELPLLKGMFRAGISSDSIPIQEAHRRGIKIGFPSNQTVEYIFEETANFACYLIIRMMYSKVGSLNPWVKFSRDILQNKELLVVGIGNIGRRVVDRMKPFMRVNTFDIQYNSMAQFKGLVSSADCVTLHIPKTSESINFFDQEVLSWMKDGSILVNTARGQIVSEEALFKEISSNRIGAAFDVFWKEPYEGKLKQFHPERFFMTPHISSTSIVFLESAAIDFKKFIKDLENG